MRDGPLGRTGITVSELCLGAMMFGAFGNADHDDAVTTIHRRARRGDHVHRHRRHLLRAASPRRSSARRWPAAATTSCWPRSSACRWASDPTSAVRRGAGSPPRGRGQPAPPRAPTGSISTRCTALDPATESRRRSSSLTDLVRAGKIRAFGVSTVPRVESSRPNGLAERRGRERFRTEQPPYSMLLRGAGGRRAADVRAPRARCAGLQPAGRRLVARAPTARGARSAGRARPRAGSGSPRTTT